MKFLFSSKTNKKKQKKPTFLDIYLIYYKLFPNPTEQCERLDNN